MNKAQAAKSGYVFTGIYSHDKEAVKRRASEIRAAGNQAVVVSVPPNKLSRSQRDIGYSVCWIESAANIAKREAEALDRRIYDIKTERQTLLNRVSELDAQIAELESNL